MNDKVNVLGAEYKICVIAREENPKFQNCDAYVDFTTKEIFIEKFIPDANSVKDLECYAKKVLRHEIVHAALYESGMDCCSSSAEAWAINEEMIDWIAIQSPKLFKMFKEADAL